ARAARARYSSSDFTWARALNAAGGAKLRSSLRIDWIDGSRSDAMVPPRLLGRGVILAPRLGWIKDPWGPRWTGPRPALSTGRMARSAAACLACALLGLALWTGVPRAHASSGPAAEARRYQQKGMTYFRANAYDEAIVEWAKSYRLKSNPELLFQIG